MKKILLMLVTALALLSGCQQNPSDSGGGAKGQEERAPSIIETGKIGNADYKVLVSKYSEDGTKYQILAYVLRDHASVYDSAGFVIVKEVVSTGSSFYKAMIIANKSNTPFTDYYFDKYEIKAGRRKIDMWNTDHEIRTTEDGTYQFIIFGKIWESSMQDLREASSLTVSLLSTEHPTRDITIQFPEKFPSYISKYLNQYF